MFRNAEQNDRIKNAQTAGHVTDDTQHRGQGKDDEKSWHRNVQVLRQQHPQGGSRRRNIQHADEDGSEGCTGVRQGQVPISDFDADRPDRYVEEPDRNDREDHQFQPGGTWER